MSAKRLKGTTLGALALLNLALLLTWTQTWVSLELQVGDSVDTVAATGETVAPALSALALAGLALIAALALAGSFFRIVLAVLQGLLAACALLSAVLPIIDPAATAAPAAIAVTGVTEQLGGSATLLPWPYLAVVVSVLLLLAAVAIIATSRRWPASSRKYQAVRTVPVDGPRDRVTDWDSMTKGDDPTGDDPATAGVRPTDPDAPGADAR